MNRIKKSASYMKLSTIMDTLILLLAVDNRLTELKFDNLKQQCQ